MGCRVSAKPNHLLCFGFGFSAAALSRLLGSGHWHISATARSEAAAAEVRGAGHTVVPFDAAEDAIANATHILSSVPPGDAGDPVMNRYYDAVAARRASLRWVGYLSTTGVYGDHGGGWVTEDTPLAANTTRGAKRVAAEEQWLGLWRAHGVPVHLFRLAGIYGPGRNVLEGLRAGTARRIIKPGQIFSRIHVDDIAGVLAASIARPHLGAAYNVADDAPCPPQDVVAYGAQLLGLPVPPDVPFDEAALSPMARSFYADSKRVANGRIKAELGYALRYPSYREGLQALLAQGI